MQKILAIVCGGVSLMLAAGCAEIPYPDLHDIDSSNTTVLALASADAARSYIARTRKNMVDQRDLLGATEFSTDGMIAAGALGGLMGGALHWAGSSITRLAALSASGAVLSDTFAPRSQLLVLDQGISAMDCVAKRAPVGFNQGADVEAALEAVHAAAANLQSDLDSLAGASAPVRVDAQIALVRAKAFEERNRPGVYEQVRLASNAIITATNTTMRKAVLDPKAFAAEVKNNLKLATTGPTPAPAPQLHETKTKGALATQVVRTLNSDIDALQVLLNAAEVIIRANPQASGAGDLFSSCIPGAVTLTLEGGPVTLKAGTSYSFSIGGGLVQGWRWNGTAPNKVTLQQNSLGEHSTFTVVSESGAAAGLSTIVFLPLEDGSPLSVTVSIQAGGK